MKAAAEAEATAEGTDDDVTLAGELQEAEWKQSAERSVHTLLLLLPPLPTAATAAFAGATGPHAVKCDLTL